MNSAGSAICGRCFAVYQEGYGHVCATPQPDWRSLADDLADTIQRIRILASNGNPMSHEKVAITLEMVDEQARAALLRYSQAREEKTP